jgi:hypothetical protein
MRVGPANLGSRRDAEQFHDLVAVQIGPDAGQFLLLG